MRTNPIKKAAVAILALISVNPPVFAVPERMQRLKGHVVQQIQGASVLGRVPAEEQVALSLIVKIDQNLLDHTLASIYGRNVKQPGRFLSSAEFAQRFGLADKRKKLKNFAAANGLTVNAGDDRDESMVVKVSGAASQVERAFHVQFNRYRRPDGNVFRAQDADPMIPEALLPDLGAVIGLSNMTGVAHPHLRVGRKLTGTGAAAAPSIAPKFSGTGPSGTVSPSDIKNVYGINSVAQDGTGQSVAIFELHGYNPVDIAAYETQFSLPSVPLTYIGVDGQTNLCGVNRNLACNNSTFATGGTSGGQDDSMIEVALDIELVAALVPEATRIYIYDSPNSLSGVIDQYDRIATDNLASVVSTSWGLYEQAGSAIFASNEQPIFARMAAQGQAVFAASGDSGAFDNGVTLSVDDPASQPYVTGVGGTTLIGTPSSASEVAWDGSGGGVSTVWSIPSYQQGVSGLASQSARNVPDVALNADPVSGYSVYVGGSWFSVGGTSASAPLWTALMALVNQQRASVGNAALGFANPTIYQIGTSGGVSGFFNDITSGDNLFYAAGAGYDNATGWGSFKGSALITGLADVSDFATLFNLSNVYAFPNPWDTRKHSVRQITIANLPGGTSVKIFTISGFLVKTLTANVDRAIWDLTNDAGHVVASGLYIYMVTHDDKKIVGKIAIIK